MFDGRVGPERKVSGAGSKRGPGAASRNALLEETRRQREERAQERQRVHGAVTIQRVVRGRRARTRLTAGLRTSFDLTISKVEKMQSIFAASASRAFQVPLATLAQLFRSFVYFHRPGVDDKRLGALLALFKSSSALVTESGLRDNVWHVAESESVQHGVWNKMLPRFFRICVTVIQSSLLPTAAVSSESDCLQLLDSIMLKITSAADEGGSGSFHANILALLVESSCVCLVQAVRAPMSGLSQKCANSMNSILIHALSLPLSSSSSRENPVWSYLCRHVLTLPQVQRHAALRPVLQQLDKNGGAGWVKSLSVYKSDPLARKNDVFFLANVFSALSGPTPADQAASSSSSSTPAPLPAQTVKALCDMLEQSSSWVSLALSVLDSAPLATLLLLMTKGFGDGGGETGREGDMAVDDPGLFTATRDTEELDRDLSEGSIGGVELLRREAARAHEHRLAAEAEATDNALRTQLAVVLNVLLDKALITRLLDCVLTQAEQALSSSSSSSASVAATARALQAVSIYSRLLSAAPLVAEFKPEQLLGPRLFLDKKKDVVRDVDALVVNQVAWSSHRRKCLSSRMWRLLSSPHLAPAVDEMIGMGSGGLAAAGAMEGSSPSAPTAPSAGALLVAQAAYLLFSVLLQQLLLTDDEEFFLEAQAVLSVKETGALAALLLRLVDAFLVLPPAPPIAVQLGSLVQRLRLSAVRLLNQLYCVNERRGFFPEELWHIKGAVNPSAASSRARNEDEDEMMGMGQEGGARNTPAQTQKERLFLSCVPQVVPFAQRVSLFQRLLEHDREAHYSQPTDFQGFMGGGANGLQVQVKRDSVVLSAFESLRQAHSVHQLKGRLRVEFISSQGYAEAGIDGGGLFKEFMDLLIRSAFDPALGLFLTTAQQQITPNPASESAFGPEHLEFFSFVGRMLGKALYDKLLVESQFCGPFLKALKGIPSQLDDLCLMDEDLHRGLMKMKGMGAEELVGLGLTFEAQRVEFGQAVSVELVPGGAQIDVTKENVYRYLHHLAHYKLNEETKMQSLAFLSGFHDMIPRRWVRMFSPRELQLLISGDHETIDVADLRRHAAYHGYADREAYMESFWEVVQSMSAQQQGQLLKFVTSCSRQPLLGFAHLSPAFGIQLVPTLQPGDDPASVRLPSAATCMNLLKLPRYSSPQQLRDKLLYAISSNSGFELS